MQKASGAFIKAALVAIGGCTMALIDLEHLILVSERQAESQAA